MNQLILRLLLTSLCAKANNFKEINLYILESIFKINFEQAGEPSKTQ